jgi:hypothetical protein
MGVVGREARYDGRVRAFGDVLIAAGATVALLGLASWVWLGNSMVVTGGAVLVGVGFVLPRVGRWR